MEDIVLKACPFMKAGTNLSQSLTLSNDLDEDMMADLDAYADL